MNGFEPSISRLAKAWLGGYSDVIRQWQPVAEIHERAEKKARWLIERTTDMSFGLTLMQNFPHSGISDPVSYMDRFSLLGDGSTVITGIRFRGGDPSKPFVDICALEGEFTTDRLRAVVAEVYSMWRAFSPRCVRLLLPSSEAIDLPGIGPGSRVDSYVVAGPVSTILAAPKELPNGFSIRPACNVDWYNEYRREYDIFHSADAEHPEWAHPESVKSFEDCVQRNDLYLVNFEGGLLACMPFSGSLVMV